MASPIPTFARTEPPDTQVTKSVISLLSYYGWEKFSIIHDEAWENVANSLKLQADKLNMTINHKKQVHDNHKCCEKDLDCCRTGYWYETVRDTMFHTRIYVFLGPVYSLNYLMEAMDSLKMFQNGEYMVVFVDMMTYSPREANQYIWTGDQMSKHKHCNEVGNYKQRARSLLVIVSTPPVENYENFTMKVRDYNKREPFNFSTPDFLKNFQKYVSIYAAYLYDSVMLYALALDKLLRAEMALRPLTEDVIREVASNGTRIVETIILNKTYQSKRVVELWRTGSDYKVIFSGVTGATIKIDQFGDSEGNFSVLALKEKHITDRNFTCDFQMMPVAYFLEGVEIPVSELSSFKL